MALACNNLQSGSSPRMRWKYDVFVSFRGDTRNNFTNHLVCALHNKNIVTFRDDTKLKKGEHILPGLLQAIEGSQILIVIFSTNYASSTWCLKELAKIADCIQVPGQSVLPIFYDVSPSEVRKQSGDYEKAFQEHEEKSKATLEEVQRWRGALKQVANLSGWDLRDKPQNVEIVNIIKEVTRLLRGKSSNLPTDIVGMQSQVEDVENHMKLDSDDVRVVGISGMGGIGKTTLATALYAKISNQFDACCFIDDVRKIFGDHGPIGVQKQILRQTQYEENLQISNLPMASNLIRTRLCQIKSLIFLDNVDEVEQLDKLDLKRECLGTGSRIIIISRNAHILNEHGVDEVYRVRLLNRKDALQLFCRKAFKSEDVKSGYEHLTYEVLKYANGLPLAIKVLGSFLYGRDVSQWKSALSRLKENPEKDIMKVLRISFDGLEDTEKDIFLDIACFFDGYSETRLKKIEDFRGFHPEIGLTVLIDRSLITCERQRIYMHDLLRELGKSIIREISPKEPRKWNRLWDYKDLYKVISENMATENLEAIVMEPYPIYIKEILEKITLRAEALTQMKRLKLLMLWNLNFSGNLNFLSSELGYLRWDRYPVSSLPSSFQPYKLVELILQHSNIKKLWEGTKVHMQSEIPRAVIRIVIPQTQIPKWFNKQNVGSSISIDPSPFMHDKNWIGIACCLTFVAHDDPTNLCEERHSRIGLGFQSKQHGRRSYSAINICLGKDLVTVDLDHLFLRFYDRECFIRVMSHITDGLHDNISGIKLQAFVEQPFGLHLEVKNCGYRWIFKEDLEQLNPQMMYTGNSSIQPYY